MYWPSCSILSQRAIMCRLLKLGCCSLQSSRIEFQDQRWELRFRFLAFYSWAVYVSNLSILPEKEQSRLFCFAFFFFFFSFCKSGVESGVHVLDKSHWTTAPALCSNSYSHCLSLPSAGMMSSFVTPSLCGDAGHWHWSVLALWFVTTSERSTFQLCCCLFFKCELKLFAGILDAIHTEKNLNRTKDYKLQTPSFHFSLPLASGQLSSQPATWCLFWLPKKMFLPSRVSFIGWF